MAQSVPGPAQVQNGDVAFHCDLAGQGKRASLGRPLGGLLVFNDSPSPPSLPALLLRPTSPAVPGSSFQIIERTKGVHQGPGGSPQAPGDLHQSVTGQPAPEVFNPEPGRER